MPKTGLHISDVKLNFKLRDFFLDFMACLVPGLIFLIAITVIVGGVIAIFLFNKTVMDSIKILLKLEIDENLSKLITSVLSSFSLNFWLIVLITILSYFAGHLLYRQTPKVPDFASFLRIRKKVIKTELPPKKIKENLKSFFRFLKMLILGKPANTNSSEKNNNEKDDWVIERGKGIKAKEVQFPYSNLKNYLKSRGFHHLTEFAVWSDETGHRSKTIINQAKIRVAFFFPEQTMHMIRNEAHIRLASSM